MQWLRRALEGRGVSIAFFVRVIVAMTVSAPFDEVDRFVAERNILFAICLSPDHELLGKKLIALRV
jgi:hypothetical protein